MSRFDRHRDPGRRASPVRVASPAELMAVLELAERFARAATDLPSDVEHAPGDLVQFRIRLRDISAESFPSPSEPARLVFGAFLNAARAFAHPAMGPETRTACAPLLREAARATDRLLTLHRTATAQGTWGRQFERDD